MPWNTRFPLARGRQRSGRRDAAAGEVVLLALLRMLSRIDILGRHARPYSRSLPNCVAGAARRQCHVAAVVNAAREDAMQPFRLMALLALVACGVPAPASAQDFYAGKTLKIIVGLEAGGTVDTMARLFVSYLRRHIPGNPLVVIQNMPSAAGVGATNFVYEKAEPDGLTILFNSWDPLAQVLGDQGMRARYENFEYVGGVGDIRVVYGRTDMVPGGLKRPADIMKAENP